MQGQEPVVCKFAARRPDWELPTLHTGLSLADDGALSMLQGRQQCPKCKKSRALYCYDCLVSLAECPSVKLPFSFSIITDSVSKQVGLANMHQTGRFSCIHDWVDCSPAWPHGSSMASWGYGA